LGDFRRRICSSDGGASSSSSSSSDGVFSFVSGRRTSFSLTFELRAGMVSAAWGARVLCWSKAAWWATSLGRGDIGGELQDIVDGYEFGGTSARQSAGPLRLLFARIRDLTRHARSGLASSQGQPLFALNGSMVVESSWNEPSTIISFRLCQVLVVHFPRHVIMHLLAPALVLVIFDCNVPSFLQYKTGCQVMDQDALRTVPRISLYFHNNAFTTIQNNHRASRE
ncbi:hypothetical protein KCU61_g31, partial [Aureobasidium melanogenum]